MPSKKRKAHKRRKANLLELFLRDTEQNPPFCDVGEEAGWAVLDSLPKRGAWKIAGEWGMQTQSAGLAVLRTHAFREGYRAAQKAKRRA